MSTGAMTSPRTSTATRSTVWSTSMPDGWMTTRAWAAVTSCDDRLRAGDIGLVVGQDRVADLEAARDRAMVDLDRDRLRHEGVELDGHRRRVVAEDRHPRIAGHVDLDRDERAARRRMGIGQVDRRPEARAGQPLGDLGRGEIADVRDLRQVADEHGRRRQLEGHDRDAAGPDLGALRQDEAGVQERRQDDRGELERPVVDDELEGASHRRAAGAAGAGDAADAWGGSGSSRWSASEARSADRPRSTRRSDPAHRPAAVRPRSRPSWRSPSSRRSMPAIAARGRLDAAVGRRAPDRAPEAGHLAARRPGHRDRADRAAAAPDERSAALAGPEETGQRRGQLGLVEVAHDPRALDQADLAALLADDDHDGVGLLGDPESRPVARPEPLDLDRGLGQRQERAGGDDLLAADDDRTVVEGGLRHEDRDQQVGRQVARGASPRFRRSPRARSHARSR